MLASMIGALPLAGPVEAGNACSDGVKADVPIPFGPVVPGKGEPGRLSTGLAGGGGGGGGGVDGDGSAPITKRQLDKRQRVIKPEESGLDITGFHESVLPAF